jgi:hypothetical protein
VTAAVIKGGVSVQRFRGFCRVLASPSCCPRALQKSSTSLDVQISFFSVRPGLEFCIIVNYEVNLQAENEVYMLDFQQLLQRHILKPRRSFLFQNEVDLARDRNASGEKCRIGSKSDAEC